MIDLGRIEEWNKNDLGEEPYEVQAIVSKGDLLDVITRLRQAEKDAARYRYLREQPCSGWEIDGEETSHIDVTMWRNDGLDNCNNGESLFGDSMDAAIDEAMQCK